jgi:VanZ family protein
MKRLFPFIWLVLILFASLTPSDKIPDFHLFLYFDKVAHFCLYAGFSFLLIPALTFDKKNNRSYILALIISVFTGILMEYCQSILAIGRTAELFDFIANCIGTVAGIASYHLFIRNKILEKKIFKI